MEAPRSPSRALVIGEDSSGTRAEIDAFAARVEARGVPVSRQRRGDDDLRRATAGLGAVDDLFVLGASPAGIASLVAAYDHEGAERLHPIALVGDGGGIETLEAAGARLFCYTLAEVEALLTIPYRRARLSLVLLAFDEEATISCAIRDARRFARLGFSEHEIIVVDDGSRDATRALARDADEGDVRLVVHMENQGMGASMRDGFLAATGDYVAPFPADRQVRPQALAPFLGAIGPDRAAVGYYESPHAGGIRHLLSAGFATMRDVVGGLHVPYDGTYLFPRRYLARVDPRRAAATSFVYSYELLAELSRLGCAFEHFPVRPFRREHGESRVANPARVARVAGELVASRARSLRAEVGRRLRLRR